ncbi:helix-turn-helix domain-containing protein [Solibacillus silvestris]|uniref:helix-turn-helix domain-containing protein n=1 Tax=Solibacillus silvestris TaxID=76853 RepID=UPI003F80E037
MTSLQVQIGERLKSVRNALGYTLQHLASVTEMHINSLMRIEGGKGEPNLIKVAKLCEFYDISIDSLVFDTGKQFEDLLNDLRGVTYDVRGAG